MAFQVRREHPVPLLQSVYAALQEQQPVRLRQGLCFCCFTACFWRGTSFGLLKNNRVPVFSALTGVVPDSSSVSCGIDSAPISFSSSIPA